MIPLKHKDIARTRFSRSSSTYLSAFFSTLILIAIGLVAYELYLYRIGDPPDRWLMQGSLGLLLSIAICLFFFGLYATRRINSIASTARRIMHTGDMSQRIPVYRRWDDLSSLSITLNSMLGEIETLVHGIRTVSDNIAHDLRHPLARLRNRLEELRDHTGKAPPETQQQELSQLIQECDTLLATFNALLRISNIESGKRHSGFMPVELHRLMNDVIEFYEPLANDRSITLCIKTDKVAINGDKDLLFQAIANLLDNAIKFTREGGTIDIRLTRVRNGACLEVDDEGCSIPAEHRSKVFNRFYRVESCRTTPGNGLGLSLVRAIIELHKGEITLEDGARKGLRVRIRL